jgi:hypothetical protein
MEVMHSFMRPYSWPLVHRGYVLGTMPQFHHLTLVKALRPILSSQKISVVPI